MPDASLLFFCMDLFGSAIRGIHCFTLIHRIKKEYTQHKKKPALEQ